MSSDHEDEIMGTMVEKFLIVGLGNPGRRYEATRHNVGFHVMDALKRRHNLPQYTEERKALTSDGSIAGKRALLAKPQTYMNNSGESVRALVDYYDIPLERVIIVHDDLDLPLGTIRLRKTGGHGGQNGVRNIILHLGTKEFARLRFGIGRPPGKMAARDYVLQKFHDDDAVLADEVVEAACNAVEAWLHNGIEQTMSQYNGDIHAAGTPNNQKRSSLSDELALAERAHELNPRDPKPLQAMIGIYRKMRRIDDLIHAYIKLADAYRAADDKKQMIRALEQAARTRPELIALREEVAIAYEEELEDEKSAAKAWIDLAWYQYEQGDIDDALASLEEGQRLNPQHPKAHRLAKELATQEEFPDS